MDQNLELDRTQISKVQTKIGKPQSCGIFRTIETHTEPNIQKNILYK